MSFGARFTGECLSCRGWREMRIVPYKLFVDAHLIESERRELASKSSEVNYRSPR